MVHALQVAVAGMGAVRIALGLAPFVAAGPLSRVLGFPAQHDSPTTRLMARLFGVRDVGLGVIAFFVLRHPDLLVPMAVFQAFMDGGDLVSMAIPLLRRDGIDRGAWRSSAFAATGAISWLVVLGVAVSPIAG